MPAGVTHRAAIAALGAGEAVVDLCAYEDCHTGSFSTVPIRLVATKLAACAANKRAYTTLRACLRLNEAGIRRGYFPKLALHQRR